MDINAVLVTSSRNVNELLFLKWYYFPEIRFARIVLLSENKTLFDTVRPVKKVEQIRLWSLWTDGLYSILSMKVFTEYVIICRLSLFTCGFEHRFHCRSTLSGGCNICHLGFCLSKFLNICNATSKYI
jgi:hypothetical protein